MLIIHYLSTPKSPKVQVCNAPQRSFAAAAAAPPRQDPTLHEARGLVVQVVLAVAEASARCHEPGRGAPEPKARRVRWGGWVKLG